MLLSLRPRLTPLIRVSAISGYSYSNIFPKTFFKNMASISKDWKLLQNENGLAYQCFTKPLVVSEKDERNYRIIQLANGLQVTLVQDSKADKAAASLDVAVGHLFDPDDMPGLAHFCEHLLFMGTEKFPRENEYSEYLAQHNGESNAYTSTTNTNYFFKVATSALSGALERFAAFFHCPLFDPSCTSRELNAVDSENTKNHQSDMWRIFQVNKHLSKPGHVWSKFGSGNRDSLTKAAKLLKSQGNLKDDVSVTSSASSTPSRKASPTPSTISAHGGLEADGGSIGRETRRRLMEWWNSEYCASRMRLAVVGKETLDELTDLVVILFSPIPNRNKDALPMIHEHPFGPSEKGTLVCVDTIMAFHALEISFPLEYQPPFWKFKPGMFIAHFVGHEGPGSLVSYLKSKQWVTSLACGTQNLARGFGMFRITVTLTPDGFRNYCSVIRTAYKYLELLRLSKLESFHHHEIVNLSAIRFRFAEKRQPDDYASSITEHMSWPVPRELLLAGPKLSWDWDNETERLNSEAKISEYLNQFRIENSRVVLMAKKDDHLQLHSDLEWEKEPWYGTEYAVKRFDEGFLAEVNDLSVISELYLPGPNEFIPTNLEVEKREVSEYLKRPHLIRETQLSTLWHKKDDRFWVPKAHVVIDIKSPVANASARASVLTRLYSEIVNDSLVEFAYNADLAGLSYNFVATSTGLYVTMGGYNDKMSILVRHVLEKIKGVVVNPEKLSVFKEEIRREWENFVLGQSSSLSDYYARYLLAERLWTVEEKLSELSSISAEDVDVHMKEVLSQSYLRILAAGNIYKDEAILIAEIAEQGLGPSTFPPADLNEKALLLPPGSNFIFSTPLPNPNQANSALTYFTYFGPIANQKIRVTSSLLAQIMSEPAFNVLRTREQLGYIVFCTAWMLPGSSERGLRIVVQSERTPTYLEARVEAFLDEMKTKLEEMPKEEFELHKISLEKKWLEADKNLADEVTRYCVHVSSGQWDFLRAENDAALLKFVTKDDALNLFLSCVHHSSPTRSKLSVHMVSQKPRPKRVSVEAAAAFEKVVSQTFPDLDTTALSIFPEDDNTTVTEFGQQWLKSLDANKAKEMLGTLLSLLDQYPVKEDEDYKRPDVTYIEEKKAFKSGLALSVDPGPVVEWNDLPLSKF